MAINPLTEVAFQPSVMVNTLLTINLNAGVFITALRLSAQPALPDF